jgi:hypothetical protein
VARLIFRNGPYAGKALQLPTGKTVTVGRNRDLELPLPDLRLSRRHCQLDYGLDGFVVRDLGSTNGTFVNGERLQGEKVLHHLDLVVIGDTEMEFQAPETIDQGQTRIGRAAGVAVSAALEPDTGLEALSPEEAAAALKASAPRSAPPSAPVPLPSPAEDPVLVALMEMDKLLPSEPPPLQAEPVQRSALLFCDNCNGSIPAIDFDLAVAKEISGKLYCKDCLAKGVAVGSAAVAAPAPAKKRDQDLDEILKGLDQVEEISIEEVPASAAPVEGAGASTRKHAPVGERPAAAPAAAPLTLDQFDELLKGEDETAAKPGPPPAPRPATKPAAKPAAAARPAPAPAPPKVPRQPDEDDDLVEIG